jgi:hypothetical protein
MKTLIFLSHPAQYLFYKNIIIKLKQHGHTVFVLIKTKDILADLLAKDGCAFHNILPKGRGQSKFHILLSMFQRDVKLFNFVRKNKVSLMLGTDASVAQIAKLMRIPSITTLEDDYSVIKNLAKLTYPFSSVILVPNVCDVGKWSKKKIGYDGYMKLAYLRPNWFTPDIKKVKLDLSKPYFLIRLSGLKAHHDFGIKGISDSLLDEIIDRLKKSGDVYISAEKDMPASYAKYILKIPVSDIHHYLYYANMLICDSQSMAVEASILGTPSIRISSFSGKISVLEELEHKYELTYGISPEKEKLIVEKLDSLLSTANIKDIFLSRRDKMLKDKIDVTAFMLWFIENYPASAEIMKATPDYQQRFR